VGKSADDQVDPANPWTHFRPATWTKQWARAAEGAARDPRSQGRQRAGGFGSAKGSTKEAYLFQKLVRTGFTTNNVDHCTRLCHASSWRPCSRASAPGAVTAPFSAALDAEVIIVIGANPTQNHPVAATFIKNAAKRGGHADRHRSARPEPVADATYDVRFKPGSDVALLNALLHTIITEDLTDKQYIEGFTEGFPDLAARISVFSPEAMEAGLWREGGDDPVYRPGLCDLAGVDHFLGAWGFPSTSTAPTTRVCLIALALVTGRSAGPAPGCIRYVARTMCRVRRMLA